MPNSCAFLWERTVQGPRSHRGHEQISEEPCVCPYSLLVSPLQAASPVTTRKKVQLSGSAKKIPSQPYSLIGKTGSCLCKKFGIQTTAQWAHFQCAQLSGCCAGLTLASSKIPTQSLTHSSLP